MGFLAALGKGAAGAAGKGAAAKGGGFGSMFKSGMTSKMPWSGGGGSGPDAPSGLREVVPNEPVKVDGIYQNPALRPGNDASAVGSPEGLKGRSGRNSSSFGEQIQGMAKGISGGGSTYQAPSYNQFQPSNVELKNDGNQFSQLMEFLRSQGSGLR